MIFVVDHIIHQESYHKDNPKCKDGHVPPNRDYLEAILGKGYRKYQNKLVKLGILEKDDYVQGKKSTYFKVNSKYADSEPVLVEITRENDKSLYNRYKNRIKQSKSKDHNDPVHIKEYRKHFRNEMKFDIEGALKYVFNNSSGKAETHHIDSIIRISDPSERYSIINRTNYRLDTNLTNIWSDLRQFVEPDIDKVHIDLRNSQPVILAIFLMKLDANKEALRGKVYRNQKEYLHQIPICLGMSAWDVLYLVGAEALRRAVELLLKHETADLETFLHSALNGKLYDDMASEMGVSRDEAKDIYFKVLFSKDFRDDPHKEAKDKFAEFYPLVSRLIFLLKTRRKNKKHVPNKERKTYNLVPDEKSGNQLFSIMLQRMESYFFIDTIAKELYERGVIYHTIHDSVIVHHQDDAEVKALMEEKFKEETGHVPTFLMEKMDKVA